MKKCVLFDLDGTLADGDHRLHHIKKEPKDWRAYFAACGGDETIPHMIELLEALDPVFKVFIVSGRSDEVRSETMAWLRKHTDVFWPEDDVIMRKAGDHRPDDEIKIEMLAEIRARGYEPLFAIDDRSRVVVAWRAAGVPCLQCAPGDF